MGHYISKRQQASSTLIKALPMNADKANWMGKAYANTVLADRAFKDQVIGGGWGKDFWRGFKHGFSNTLKQAGPVASMLGVPEVGIPATVLGSAISGKGISSGHKPKRRRGRKRRGAGMSMELKQDEKVGSGVAMEEPVAAPPVEGGADAVGAGGGGGKRQKKVKKKRQLTAKQLARGRLVGKLMREQGLKMGEASHKIAQEKIPY